MPKSEPSKLERAVADLKQAMTGDNEEDGIEAVGLIIFCAFDVFERIAGALERIASPAPVVDASTT